MSLNEIKARAQALSKHWAEASDEAAPAVLGARSQFANASLADLHDPLSMTPLLLKAHQKLVAAFDKSYERCAGKKWKNNAERMAFLFSLYE